ncbi:MAG: PH domain-containing protein, partial [Angelakisella sp.]
LMAIMVFVPLALTAFVCGMQFFATGYTLDGDLLIAKSGLSKVMVAYGDITLVTYSKDNHADGYVPLATSSRRIYIFYTQDDKSYRLELSPYDMEGFVKALEEKL